MKRAAAIILVVTLVLSFSAISFADGRGATTKLDRGVKNVVLGVTELPKAIVDTSKSQNVVVGVTLGTIEGVLNTFARVVSGIADVVTFPAGAYNRPSIKPSMTGAAAPAAK